MSPESKSDLQRLLLFAAVFGGLYFLPVGTPRFDQSVDEALHLARDYAREHVILCLLPAFWIAGAIAAFVSQASVLRYLGPKAHPVLAYGVASVSGTILAVCSCTVLPLFAGIYRMGAGLGPASAFLYSGPAINVLAIVLTAKILGLELGLARGIAAVVFSVVLGLLMAWLFRRDQLQRAAQLADLPVSETNRPLGQTSLFFAAMIAVLVFANWANPKQPDGFFAAVHGIKCMTIGKLVDAEKPLIWRGPMAHGAFKQLTEQTQWGELDYLIIDLPPGTGDISLTMAQNLKLTGAVVVCTPQRVAQDDAVRAARMFQQLGIEVLGVVENMSFFVGDDGKVYDIFGKGGAETMAQRLGVPFLGAIPITMSLRANSDSGNPTANFEGGTPADDRLKNSIEAVLGSFENQVALATMKSGQSRPTLTIS